jgi:hypothetical protein
LFIARERCKFHREQSVSADRIFFSLSEAAIGLRPHASWPGQAELSVLLAVRAVGSP